jgi:hypothetical protein
MVMGSINPMPSAMSDQPLRIIKKSLRLTVVRGIIPGGGARHLKELTAQG